MKNRVIALALALCLALSLPVFALDADSFSGGRLSGVCADGDALIVTDTYNKVLWRVDGGTVSRFAGVIGVPGISGEPVGAYLDGAAEQAYFMEPWDVVPFLNGFAVSDAGANALRYVSLGRVQTLAGTGKAGKADGDAKTASFDRPTGLATDSKGALYVADTGNGAIRRVGTDGKVTTVVSGLSAPTGLCWYDGALYVAETGRSRILRVVNGSVEPFAGISTEAEDAGEYYGGYADAPAATAKFDHPQYLTAGTDGTLYIADTGNSAIRAIRDGRVYTLLRGTDTTLTTASPRGLIVRGDTLLIADQLTGTLQSVLLARKTYSDVAPGIWYASAVDFAAQNGIADGTGNGLFEPDTPLNRAMFVTMLSRVHLLTDGTAIINGDASFPDVAANEWYAAPVRWAADSGITNGSDDGFAPLRSISREELAAMLYRYAASQGMDVSASADALSAFPDASAVSPWAIDAMRWACTRGVMRGDGNGSLLPAAQATRAGALTMLLNFMNAYSL